MRLSKSSQRLNQKITKYFKSHARQRVLIIFGFLIIIAFASTALTQIFLSLQVETPKLVSFYTISNETVYSPPIEIMTNGPSYFQSVAKVYAYESSKYASAFNIFDVCLSLENPSLDNSSWIKIPLLPSQTYDRSKMAYLGVIKLDNPKVAIYQKYYIPPQDFKYPINATKTEITNSFIGYVQIVREPSSLDTGKSLFAFFVFFGAILTTYNFFKNKNSRK